MLDQACYSYQYVVPDTWGNTTTYTSGDVKVDTTAPAAPTRSFQTLDDTYWNGSSSLVYYRSAAATGSFTVTASATDPASGIAAYTFPTATAFGTNWSATPGGLDEMTYSWSGTPQTVTAKSITATNHAAKVSVGQCDVHDDRRQHRPDRRLGVVSQRRHREHDAERRLHHGTDTRVGPRRPAAAASFGPADRRSLRHLLGVHHHRDEPHGSPYVDTVTEGNCYQYRYDTPDNVGNPRPNTSASVVRVSADVAGPSGGSLTATGLVGTGSTYSTATTANLTFSTGTDPSGVATTGNLLQRASAPLISTGGADGVCGTFGAFATVRRPTPSRRSRTPARPRRLLALPVRRRGHVRQHHDLHQRGGQGRHLRALDADPQLRRLRQHLVARHRQSGLLPVHRASRVLPGHRERRWTPSPGSPPTTSRPKFGTNWSATPGDLRGDVLVERIPAGGDREVDHGHQPRHMLNSIASTTFTPTVDNAAPTGGTVTYPHNGTHGPTVNVTLGTVTDAGSGSPSRLLQRASAPLTGGTCGTFSAFSTIATNPV